MQEILNEIKKYTSPTKKLPQVRGKVLDQNGKPIANVLVIAYDLDLRTHEELGRQITNKLGKFKIEYNHTEWGNEIEKDINIRVRVYDILQKHILYETPMNEVRFDAKDDELFEIVLDRKDVIVISKYQEIYEKIKYNLQRVGIHELREDEKHQDISYICMESNTNRSDVEKVVFAHKLSFLLSEQNLQIEPEFFYGLLTQDTVHKNLDSNIFFSNFLKSDIFSDPKAYLANLSSVDENLMRKDLTNAHKTKKISSTFEKDVTVLRKYLKQNDSLGASSNLNLNKNFANLFSDLLSTQEILNERKLFEKENGNIFDKLKENKLFESKKDERSAKIREEISNYLGTEPVLVEELKTKLKIKKPEEVSKLAKLNKSELLETLKSIKNLSGNSNVDIKKSTLSKHASITVRNLEKEFPNIAYNAQVLRSEAKDFVNSSETVKLFKKNENIDLRNENLDKLFAKEKVVNHEVISDLKTRQRIFKLIPHFTKSNKLIEKGITSARDITNMGRKRFVSEIVAIDGISEMEANEIFDKAQNTTTKTMLVAGELMGLSDTTEMAFKYSSATEKLEAVSKDFPSLKTLFKGIDTFDCKHCRSVYSPSAYLVELYEFLDKRTVTDLTASPVVTTNIAKDELFRRRPDLGEIDLSCENSNTMVPYIDLVCEVLEEQVSPQKGISYTGDLATGTDPNVGKIHPDLLTILRANKINIDEDATVHHTESTLATTDLPHYIRSKNAVLKAVGTTTPKKYKIFELRQTLQDEKSLSAYPQYVNEDAYDKLSNSSYAFNLPFELFHKESLEYLTRLDVKHSDLYEVFAKTNPATEAVSASSLNISERQRKIIFEPDVSNQQKYWNTTTSNASAEMEIVDTILKKTGLTYIQLDHLLSLDSVDKNKNLYIKHLDLTPDTTKKVIKNLDDSDLDIVHRFLRFYKLTSLKFSTIDELVLQKKFGDKKMNYDFLKNYVNLLKISELSGIKLDDLICSFGEIPHIMNRVLEETTLYDKIFQNKSKVGKIDPDFEASKIDGSLDINDKLQYISLCLKLKVIDLTKLVTLLSDSKLTFSNLSKLFFYSKLVNKMKLKVDELVKYFEILSSDPTDSTQDALEFVKSISEIKSLPLSASDLQYYLLNTGEVASKTIKDDSILSIASSLQREYQNSFQQLKNKYEKERDFGEQLAYIKETILSLASLTADHYNLVIDIVNKKYASLLDATNDINIIFSIFFDTTSVIASLGQIDTVSSANLQEKQNEFCNLLCDEISQFNFREAKYAILVENLVNNLKLESEIAEMIVNQIDLVQSSGDNILEILTTDTLIDVINENPVEPTIDEASFPEIYKCIRYIHKFTNLIQLLGLDRKSLEIFLENRLFSSWFDITMIPFESTHTTLSIDKYIKTFKLFAKLKNLEDVIDPADNTKQISVQSVFAEVIDGANRDRMMVNLSELLGEEVELIDDLDKYFNTVFSINFYQEVENWLKLFDAIEIAKKLNLTCSDISSLLVETFDENSADTLRVALKSRFDEETWIDTLKNISDKIRPLKRDALVSYLLFENPDLQSSNDLYDYFLIDTQMESVMNTSRIVLAHGSTQLFIQRCLMGLEPTSSASVDQDSGWEQWTWMRNYRVWEANRKIFLYPENWLEPEMRDDKSYLFKEFEEELEQNELNDYNIEQAFCRYVEKLDEIAFLEVVATWYDQENFVMHIFGRTKGSDPHSYFYRTLTNERVWSAWMKVDLEITSSQVVAFMRNNRLSLAWLNVSYESDPDSESTIPSSTPGTVVDNDKPRKKMKIQLAVSEYANNLWQPKKISNDAILTPNYYTSDNLDASKYNIMYLEATSQVLIFTSDIDYGSEYHQLSGIFNLSGCKGYPELAYQGSTYFPDFYPDINDANLKSQRYHEMNYDSSDKFAIRNAVSMFYFYDVLLATPGQFRITYPLQFTKLDFIALLFQYYITGVFGKTASIDQRYIKLPLGTLLPYFDEDSSRAYVIIPGFYPNERRKPRTHESTEISTEIDPNLKKTASDVLKLIQMVTNLIVKYKAKFDSDPSYDSTKFIAELVIDDDFIDIINELNIYAKLRYGEKFLNHYHPLVCSMRKTLYSDGIGEFMQRENQLVTTNFDFDTTYQPTFVVPKAYPIEDIDFTAEGSYSMYNWEMFYHMPSLIANKLTNDQKFEIAQKWHHYIFNPTGALSGPIPQRFWVTKPFFLAQDSDYFNQRIDNIMYNLADVSSPFRSELEVAVDFWRKEPFKPHTVAKLRPVAYQKAILMKYINNLIEWGDNLFRQDTMESIVQATQMYILADKLLGDRPRVIPNPIEMPNETYNQMERKLDAFSNAIIDLENILPDISVMPEGGDELPTIGSTLGSLYFCIPKNEQMLSIWDTVDDRLFKIRNSQNIDGVFRSLALFAPPIDPSALVKAVANGADLSSVLSALSAPTPYYRFNLMVGLAADYANEVRLLGNELLSLLEKKDAESMAQMRSNLENKILKMQKDAKILQIDEAKAQLEVLLANRRVSEERKAYYSSLEKINSKEQLNMDKLDAAVVWQVASTATYSLGAALALIPDLQLGASGFGGSPHGSAKFGGSLLAHSTDAIGKGLSIGSTIASFEATRAATLGQYDRRYSDWQFQVRIATKEIASIDKQLVVANTKIRILEQDYKIHMQNMDNWKKTDEMLRAKFTNKVLYSWMSGELTKTYFKVYKLAHDMALKAERSYQYELGNDDKFIDFGYWDSFKKGLMTADKLVYDLKKMQSTYIAKNKRNYEISKSISLAKLDPLALQRIRLSGSCEIEIPEAIFDMDYAGQYARRIKAVSISIPCITGPYTSVSAKLTQVSNKYRKNNTKISGASSDKEAYEELVDGDDRFVYNVGNVQSIATSHSQNDAGMFELNFSDERYLPFEGTGAISSWRLELPKIKQFDYMSIADIVIHMSYTAKEGGSSLKAVAESSLLDKLSEINQDLNQTGTHHSFNMRTTMPKEWNLLKKNGVVNIKIAKSMLPYFVQPLDIEMKNTILLAEVDTDQMSFTMNVNASTSNLSKLTDLGVFKSEVAGLDLDTDIEISVSAANKDKLKNLEIVVKYGVV